MTVERPALPTVTLLTACRLLLDYGRAPKPVNGSTSPLLSRSKSESSGRPACLVRRIRAGYLRPPRLVERMLTPFCPASSSTTSTETRSGRSPVISLSAAYPLSSRICASSSSSPSDFSV